MDLRYGTKIELPASPLAAREVATIGRWNRAINGERIPGYHVVKFADGGRLLMHETRFVVLQCAS